MTLSEVSHRLQQVRIDLEKAVDLMEREQPGKKKNILISSEDVPTIFMVLCPFAQVRR